MSIATGIPPSVWAEEGERAVVTAFDLLARQGRPERVGGPQMRG